MKQRVKKLSEKTLMQNPWWDYKLDHILWSNGQEGDYYYGVVKNGSVIIVPILDDGRFILIQQYRYLHDKFCIEFPSGGINTKEFAINAAKRELREETGYTSRNFINVGLFENTAGLLKNTIHLFIANKLCYTVLDTKPDYTEDIKIITLSVGEVEEMIRKGKIWDGKTLAAWAVVRSSKLLYGKNRRA
ncbi:MAG: NUDIX hydrolase [Patescibacteria group bacterium]